MTKDFINTTVIDAGGRFGIHPTWKQFNGELNYHLFEPDITEAKRLKEKYVHRTEITVSDLALLDKPQEARLFHLNNHAMSTLNERNNIVEWFKGGREHEEEIVGHSDVISTTIDTYCLDNNMTVDFLKLDTEGSEYKILKGSESQLSENILGVRSEVNFDYIFENSVLFPEMHSFMLDNGYYLLNLDYDGRGDYRHEAVKCTGRYGVLMYTDAVWLKRTDQLFDRNRKDTLERVLKYAAFCMHNYAEDVAISILLSARNEKKLNFEPLSKTKLYKHVDYLMLRHFYNLKWQPAQSISKNGLIYQSIFKKKMLETHEYNQSLIMNPD